MSSTRFWSTLVPLTLVLVVDWSMNARTTTWSGEAEIGVQQVAELRPVAGVDVIGELPPELQKKIPYSAGVAAKAKDAATARALVTFLRSQPAMDVLKRKGMDLP